MKHEVWKYGVVCVGIKKRCRKSERHTTDKDACGVGVEVPNEAEAIRRAKIWIEKNMKSVTKAYATATRWEIDGDIQQWQPFTPDHNLKYKMELTP